MTATSQCGTWRSPLHCDCDYLTPSAGVDLVLELSGVNALLARGTDGVLPRVLHLQRTTRLARLKLSQSSFLANKKQERSTRHFKERSLLNPTDPLKGTKKYLTKV